VTSAEKDDMEVIAVVMKGNRDAVNEDTISLLNFGLNSFSIKTIVEKGTFIDSFTIDDTEEVIPLIANDDLFFIYNKEDNLNIHRELVMEISEDTNFSKGEVVGKAIYKNGDDVIGFSSIITTRDIVFPEKKSFSNMASVSFMSIPWWAYIIAIYLIWRVRVEINRRKRSRNSFVLFNKRKFGRRF